MRHVIGNEDGDEHGEEEEEAEHHCVEEVLNLPQDYEAEDDEDMEAEEKFEPEVSILWQLRTRVFEELEDQVGAGDEDEEP